MIPEWFEFAKSKIGEHEVKGGENPFILECHACTTLHAKDDETAWCSAFLNRCFKEAGIKGTGSAAASSWETWGIELAEPQHGCVVVLPHHVTQFDTFMGNGLIRCLGGNQGDSVKYSNYKMSEVISYRWPKEGVL
jgi:uncharacterized protein (TIGR02594 family)